MRKEQPGTDSYRLLQTPTDFCKLLHTTYLHRLVKPYANLYSVVRRAQPRTATKLYTNLSRLVQPGTGFYTMGKKFAGLHRLE